jgi:hypothetical protein
MPTFDGNNVSAEWNVVLLAARADGVRFRLNDGRRTMAEQWARYNVYRRYGHPIAAFPSPTAPHIRLGRPDHALDINALDGGADRFDRWCTECGFPLDNTVRSEAWHKEIRGGPSTLRRLAARIEARSEHPIIRKGSHPSDGIKHLQVLLRRHGFLRGDWKVHRKYTIKVRRAVRDFQRAHHLRPDGVVGPATWKLLEKDKR